MGLSVVLGVVQSLGGDIQVESKVGKGTTFKLYLPVVEESISGHDADDDSSPIATEPNEYFLLMMNRCWLKWQKICLPRWAIR